MKQPNQQMMIEQNTIRIQQSQLNHLYDRANANKVHKAIHFLEYLLDPSAQLNQVIIDNLPTTNHYHSIKFITRWNRFILSFYINSIDHLCQMRTLLHDKEFEIYSHPNNKSAHIHCKTKEEASDLLTTLQQHEMLDLPSFNILQNTVNPGTHSEN